MSQKANLESKEDSNAYITFLSKVEKEVDQWPQERKMRRSTSFYEDLGKPKAKKAQISRSEKLVPAEL